MKSSRLRGITKTNDTKQAQNPSLRMDQLKIGLHKNKQLEVLNPKP